MRREILDAASRLLSELGGEDGLTIRGVARAVGIAPASIYQHFTDRSALVAGLLDYEFARLRAAMEAAEASEDPDDVVGRVRALLHAYCRFAMENPGHHRLMMANGVTRPGPEVRPQGPLPAIVDLVITGFARCDAGGFPLRVPAERAGVIAFVGAHGRVALFHNSPERANAATMEPFVDEVVSLVFA
ncbi:TetR/AcrR family transcriptional regulator [Amycolatopsis sp. DSM 110486]|nr:TetR/AcrR family transcriptional regulator [Amycolatopsis sp. DSM 110486]